MGLFVGIFSATMIAPGILESTVKVSAISDSPQVENREENIAKHEQEAFDNDRNDKGQ
jgi:hypothetical protein